MAQTYGLVVPGRVRSTRCLQTVPGQMLRITIRLGACSVAWSAAFASASGELATGSGGSALMPAANASSSAGGAVNLVAVAQHSGNYGVDRARAPAMPRLHIRHAQHLGEQEDSPRRISRFVRKEPKGFGAASGMAGTSVSVILGPSNADVDLAVKHGNPAAGDVAASEQHGHNAGGAARAFAAVPDSEMAESVMAAVILVLIAVVVIVVWMRPELLSRLFLTLVGTTTKSEEDDGALRRDLGASEKAAQATGDDASSSSGTDDDLPKLQDNSDYEGAEVGAVTSPSLHRDVVAQVEVPHGLKDAKGKKDEDDQADDDDGPSADIASGGRRGGGEPEAEPEGEPDEDASPL
eukprot:TRINITY_DN55205_c0_g1_i1.p1 TRINITY_DN55205_c0_g1~~TRINITY_DN55205_c0_g1_i1.p1  ORF type:complete len:351 (-),score=80.08 TRINITY_DN55205_c0_g1_i1:42-1094(-)